MKKINKVGIIMLVGVIIITAFMTIRRENSHGGGEILIGAILPLTGAQAQDGVELRNALLLAREHVNKLPGEHKLSIDIVDSKYSVKDAIALFNIMQQKHPSAIIVGGSVIALSLAPMAEKSKIPIITLLASDDALPDCNDWVFRAFPSDKEEIVLMADFARDILQVKSAAVMAVDNMQGMSAIKYFEDAFGSDCVRAKDTYDVSGKDMRPQIAKILRQSPEAIYVFGYGIGYCACINQIYELGFKGPVLTWDAMSLDSYQDAVKATDAEIYYSSPQFSATLNDRSKMLAESYSQKYGGTAGFLSAFAYETIFMLHNVVNECGISADDVRRGLSKVENYLSATGNIGFNGKRGLHSVPVIYKLKNHKAVLMSR